MTEPETQLYPLAGARGAAARRWLETGCPAGEPPRLSASVCLLRQGPDGVEVLWIRRARTLTFAGGMLAFPGGVVEDTDLAARDGRSPDRYTVLRRAGSRELHEETALLVPPADLAPLTRWVTPAYEPRRYDTTFLVAGLAEADAPARFDPAEVAEAGWAGPADLLAAVAAGEHDCLPPTRAVLARLRDAAATVGMSGPGASGVLLRRLLTRLVRDTVPVPVVPRAVWVSEVGGEVGLLLPRHAGEVP